MHPFSDLALRCTALTQGVLRESRERILSDLQSSGATILVKALQAIELQQAMVAVGMVAMFEAALQDALECRDGFEEALGVIEGAGDGDLARRFRDLHSAINVLKHGKGRSHDALLARRGELPFRVRSEDESFDEGDVAEVATLVKADEGFLAYCAETIDQVSTLIKKQRPNAFL